MTPFAEALHEVSERSNIELQRRVGVGKTTMEEHVLFVNICMHAGR